MSDVLHCWRCSADLASIPLPLSRRDVCPACEADLHVCRMCRQMDVSAAKCCREPTVDEVRDKQRANFCDLFSADPLAHKRDPNDTKRQAQADLEALFGLRSPEPTRSLRPDAQALLKQRDAEAAQSRQALGALFNADSNKPGGGAGE